MDTTFSERLRGGEKLFGTLIVSPSPQWAGNFARLGIDFVFIDTEHIAINRDKLAWMCQTYRALNLNPIIRILSPDPYLATAVLDGGACGIIAPYVETVEEARNLVGALKMRPLRGKKLNDFLTGKESPSEKLNDYILKDANSRTLILNIESVEAIKNLDDILSVPGIDGILIGPHDLSTSLESPEDYRNPVFDEAVCDIIQRARAKGVGAGIHFIMGADNIDLELKWIEAGANFIVHSADIIAARDALKKEFAILKSGSLSGAQAKEEADAINI